ncbi:SRPBCC family protein [Sphingobacterium daejeonense]|uniref:SRPBCC family protein n=1 Tax=Sphingobacterium daejeonense TaxID=371142 RepID=UPI0010C3B3A3|nr:SRPBCC family protein [Sphingobacterium daejeonense]VTP97110.1 Activator of Hsp90 ATPase homolog 1-like protein [Sphingobacterium daejeonense]
MEKKRIHIESLINAPLDLVWDTYNNPEDIKQWNHASDDLHCPSSQNDLRVGGKFNNKMAAKDGSFEFDFEGTYTEVTPKNSISYVLGDNRTTDMKFQDENGKTKVLIDFDAEETNPEEMQREGWQSILDNFKKHVESKA